MSHEVRSREKSPKIAGCVINAAYCVWLTFPLLLLQPIRNLHYKQPSRLIRWVDESAEGTNDRYSEKIASSTFANRRRLFLHIIFTHWCVRWYVQIMLHDQSSRLRSNDAVPIAAERAWCLFSDQHSWNSILPHTRIYCPIRPFMSICVQHSFIASMSMKLVCSKKTYLKPTSFHCWYQSQRTRMKKKSASAVYV